MKAIFTCCIYLFLSFHAIGQRSTLDFTHLTLEHGLSQSSVAPILKDSQGFMWFGTEDGLNRYDGTSFKVYRHIPNDEESLSSSYILSIVEKQDGFLWIGTKNGLNFFDPYTEKFQRFIHSPEDSRSLGNDSIRALLISSDGKLLIGTSDGLYGYDSKQSFYRIDSSDVSYSIIDIDEDSLGNIWVLTTTTLEKISSREGTYSLPVIQKSFENSFHGDLYLDVSHVWIGLKTGIIKLNMNTGKSRQFKFYDVKGSIDDRIPILSIEEASNRKLWMGSAGGGLMLFDKVDGSFETFIQDANNHLSLTSDHVASVFQDDTGILWVGTHSGGINKHDPNRIKFEHFKYENGNKSSLNGNIVRSFLRDKDGELWIGTHDGLKRTTSSSKEHFYYRNDPNNPLSISSNIIRALAQDSKGTIWAGSWSHGLNRLNKNKGEFKRYRHLPGHKDSINHIPALTIDNEDNIWIGSSGLWKYNPTKELSKNYFFTKNKKPKYYIRSLHFASDSGLWVGTSENGLIRVDTLSGTIQKFLHDPNEPTTLSHNSVVSIAEDEQGMLWLGTYGGGINVLDPKNGTFQHYNSGNGLLNDVIYGILIDKQGFVWFTSNAGLSRLNPKTKELRHFSVEYGIQSEEFNAGAYYKSEQGEFFFGGINGYNVFYPDSINKETKVERIVFTDLEILDEKRKSANTALVEKSITKAEHIELPYNQNNLAISFAELNYSDNVNHSYEYLVKGASKIWKDLGQKRTITIAGLNPGEYELITRVRNEPLQFASVRLTVLPPFWRTYWAYALYLLLVTAIITLIYQQQKKFEKARQEFELKITNWENGSETLTKSNTASDLTETIVSVKDVNVTSVNQKFLNRAIQIVEDNIDDSTFGVDKFMGEMFMSRSQLHRKLKAATGYSTTKFIRFIRLKRAAQLLKGNDGTVAEIAYKVGFENVGYFSKCFSETFGVPPSQYKA